VQNRLTDESRADRNPRGTRLLVLALASIACHGVSALKLEVLEDRSVEIRDGVITRPDGTKVSSPDLPFFVGQSASAATAPPPIVAAGSATFSGSLLSTLAVVADPGDAPDASLCISFRYTSTITGRVIAATGGIAAASGGGSAILVDASVLPVTAAALNPASVVVIPTVGPARTIFSRGPLSIASTGAEQSATQQAQGAFLVRAGDTIDYSLGVGYAIRAEPTTGAATANASQSLQMDASPSACAAQAVPGLSIPALVLLAALLVGSYAAVNRRRRPRTES